MASKNYLSVYGAALWSLIFGIFHLLWASGHYILLPLQEAEKAFSRPSFYIYNLIVAGLCIVAVIFALIQSEIIQTRIPKSIVRLTGYAVVLLLLVRGLAGVIQISYLFLTEGKTPSLMILWDFWFCLGGLLFLLNAVRAHRKFTES